MPQNKEIISEFAPTWLYIKRHQKTGLKYFGKTIKDPKKYIGSGKYWKNHIRLHGRDIETIWCNLFLDKNSLVEFAEFFSEFFNIVNEVDANKRKIWANEVPENGLSGGQNVGMPSPLKGKSTGKPSSLKGKSRPEHSKIMSGRKLSAEHKLNISKSLKKHIRTPEHCLALSNAKKGIPNLKLSIALKKNSNLNSNKGKKLKTYKCLHCNINTTGGNLKRWHNENCKTIKEIK